MDHPSLIHVIRQPTASGGGYNTVEDEGVAETQRTTLNFVGAGVDVTDVGGKTQINIAGAAGASWTTMEADLGSSPTWRGSFTITDAAITPTSKIIIQQAPGPYTGKGTRADEAEMDPIWCVAEPGSGSATVRWRTATHVIYQAVDGPRNRTSVVAGTLQAVVASIMVPVVVGRVKGNVKFHYTVAS